MAKGNWEDVRQNRVKAQTYLSQSVSDNLDKLDSSLKWLREGYGDDDAERGVLTHYRLSIHKLREEMIATLNRLD